ncbi:MAG: hypothetical protein JXA08_01165 [Methanomicrobiaceae archaeon]|nr:hypothetical protein [Methanomicrobiaceae archaeon]
MADNGAPGFILPFVPVLALLAVIAYPFLLDRLLLRYVYGPESRSEFGRKHPVLILLIIAAIAAIVGGILMAGSSGGTGTAGTAAILGAIATVSASGVLIPHAWFPGRFSGSVKRNALLAGSVFQFPFLIALLTNPEIRAGGPPPLFADRLPLLGMVFDAVAAAGGTAETAGYEVFFTAALNAGLFIETAAASTVVFLVISALTRTGE